MNNAIENQKETPSAMSGLLKGFVHMTGRHCGSTALSDVMKFYGWPLSEAACFGLGSGLAYYFRPPSAEMALGIFMGRCRNLEENFFANCEIPFKKISFATYAEFRAYVKDKIASGEPVLLQGDIAGLPYYKSPIHFPGHKFVICGMHGDSYIVADTAFPEFQLITDSELDKTTAFEAPAWAGARVVFEVGKLPELTETSAKGMILKAIEGQIRELTKSTDAYFLSWENAHESWKEHTALAAAPPEIPLLMGARAFYQVIEKRGTGGGAFRGIYLDFARELMTDRLLPIKLAGVSSLMSGKKTETNLQRLVSALEKCRDKLSEIAGIYKLYSMKKISGPEAENKLQDNLQAAWVAENNVLELLKQLSASFTLSPSATE